MEEQETHAGPDTLRTQAFRKGWVVLAVLVVLTLIEYAVAQALTSKNLPVMIVMNVADAALIMVYFMHLPRLWRRGGGH